MESRKPKSEMDICDNSISSLEVSFKHGAGREESSDLGEALRQTVSAEASFSESSLSASGGSRRSSSNRKVSFDHSVNFTERKVRNTTKASSTVENASNCHTVGTHDSTTDSHGRLLPYRLESDSELGFDTSSDSVGAGFARSSRRGSHLRKLPSAPLAEKMNPRSTSDTHAYPRALWNHSTDVQKKKLDNGRVIYTGIFSWDTMDGKWEPDDDLHDPETLEEKLHISDLRLGKRAVINVGVLFTLIFGLLLLFAGYPIISYCTRIRDGLKGGFNLGGTNGSGQIGTLPGMRTGLIDAETPKEAYERIGLDGSTKFKLVFSDEFNVDGRSFYPGDDPFWEAVDLHYWGTNNYEWYDPAAITTANGALQITLSQTLEHNLNFRGGMLQSWNKFCFTGGYIVASVQMPGSNSASGLWPAFWTMGNLGRAGYGASLEGTWPYSYDSCDVGTMLNQTNPDGTPSASLNAGDVMFNRKHHTKSVSFLSGQRLSACTCPDDDHPGPRLKDGTWKGRASPEIDIFEGQVDSRYGMTVSQSCQMAPFNAFYNLSNSTGPAYELYGLNSELNIYTGEVTQQALSVVTEASQGAMQRGGDASFAEYGYEYEPGDDGYIEWVSDGKPAWKLLPSALDPDPVTQISRRPFPSEPMYIIFNLGISQNFGEPSWDKMEWPNIMKVDWVRVYQPEHKINIGCDPEDFPTKDYIERHMEAYTNPNLTIWGGTRGEGGYGENWPRNRLLPEGCGAPLSNIPGSPVQPYAKAAYVPASEIAVGQN
ncbi:beta-glucan synthesis-associated [Violaceomyces palustris]|uniref:Beta-glucan synthesis-associated n=1 Tax=Violaceomyces palustris TaxID=1673888 RepID=A0ACD0NY70_9BASI|nr:beta-glucan synthesis-associated [Violaceomyces palustris]